MVSTVRLCHPQLTKRGTRPGDPTADLLFGFTLSALVKAVQHCLASKGLLPDPPACPDRPDFVGMNESVRLGFPAWADDFVSPQTGTDTNTAHHPHHPDYQHCRRFRDIRRHDSEIRTRQNTALLMSPRDICRAAETFSVDEDGNRSLQLYNSVSAEAYPCASGRILPPPWRYRYIKCYPLLQTCTFAMHRRWAH